MERTISHDRLKKTSLVKASWFQSLTLSDRLEDYSARHKHKERLIHEKIVISAEIAIVTKKLASIIDSLPPNTVVKLPSSLGIDAYFPPTRSQLLFGLRLTVERERSMARSGFVYGKYVDACRQLNADPRIIVVLYTKDGFFKEYGQFGMLEMTTVLFLGFGSKAQKVLEHLIHAESRFNPADFDMDGYAICI